MEAGSLCLKPKTVPKHPTFPPRGYCPNPEDLQLQHGDCYLPLNDTHSNLRLYQVDRVTNFLLLDFWIILETSIYDLFLDDVLHSVMQLTKEFVDLQNRVESASEIDLVCLSSEKLSSSAFSLLSKPNNEAKLGRFCSEELVVVAVKDGSMMAVILVSMREVASVFCRKISSTPVSWFGFSMLETNPEDTDELCCYHQVNRS
ncbi:hypothetical protein Tco_1503601 [Tanacetum coccineum]